MQKKKYKKKTLVLIVSILMILVGGIRVSAAQSDLDSHGDDPKAGMFSKDDFNTVEEWENYLEQHPELKSKKRTAVLPENKVEVQAELEYTIRGLPKEKAIQRFYLHGDEIYVTQRKGKDTYLSRCLIDKGTKTANYQDHMVLENFGHGQTLDYYEYKGNPYFWVSCKANDVYSEAWSMQIGRISYDGGKNISNYTKICRFSNLNYANQEMTSFGNVKRVDASLSEDGSKLLFWVQNTENDIQYSSYPTAVLNQLLDTKENESSKHIPFENNIVLKEACLGSFTQKWEECTLPNFSQQGLGFSNDSSIYLVGGKVGEHPRMSVMTGGGSFYHYSCLADLLNESFGENTEIEGIQLKGNQIYFGICEADHKDEQQYIYSIGKKSVDMSGSSHRWNTGIVEKEPTCTKSGEKKIVCTDCGLIRYEMIPPAHKEQLKNVVSATCTTEGYTGDTCCSVCGIILKKGTHTTALGHQLDDGTVTTKPTAVKKGVKTYRCIRCGTQKKVWIKANGIPPKGRNLRYGSSTYKVTKEGSKKGTVEFVKTTSKSRGIRIPSTVNIDGITYKVTSIAANAFRNNKRLTKLITGEYVTKIGSNAMSGCTRLESVSIRNKTTCIGTRAFYKCTKLKKVSIPSSVNKIGSQAFYGCRRLKTLQIKTSELTSKRVGSNAFKGISSKATIKVPKKKLTFYKKLMRQKGVSRKVKIKK